MALCWFLAAACLAIDFETTVERGFGVAVPFFPTKSGEDLLVESRVDSSSEFFIEISNKMQCGYENGKNKTKLHGVGATANMQTYHTESAGKVFFKVCPKENHAAEIKGTVVVNSALHGYSTYERPDQLEYHNTLCWLFGLLCITWLFVLKRSENVSYSHVTLTVILMLFTLNQIADYLVERNYNLHADQMGFRPELTLSSVIYALRNTALLLWGIQASSGFGILYTEWTPMDCRKQCIAGGFFVLDLSTLIALQLTPKLHHLYCAHNLFTVFRSLILISTALIYSSFNFAEMALSNEAIGIEVKAAYARISNFLTWFLTFIAAGLMLCVYLMKGNSQYASEAMRYFWLIQNDWINFASLCFLTGTLFFYRPKASLAQGFYKNANLQMGSECDSFRNSAKSELSEPLV